MGCDIHFYVEKRVNGKWVSADSWEYNKDYEHEFIPYEKRFYDNRNYDTFAILADVRNGYGCAGCDTGDGFIFIDKPRGLPEDTCNEVKEEAERWGCDGHSSSWFTLKELLDWDKWDYVTNQRGYLKEDDYLKWDKIHEPKSYCGGAGGHNIKCVSEQEYIELMKEGQKVEAVPVGYYIKITWKQSYKDCTGNFYIKTIPALQKIDNNPENVRIVFWFDN